MSTMHDEMARHDAASQATPREVISRPPTSDNKDAPTYKPVAWRQDAAVCGQVM